MVDVVRNRLDERAESLAAVARAAESAKSEKESRAQSEKVQSEREATLRDEVR